MGDLPQSFTVTALLYAFFAVTQTSHGVYLSYGIEPPPAYALLHFVGVIWIFGWWLRQDLRKHKVGFPMDLGMFLSMAWPAVVPYYLFRTRGLRGLLIVFTFIVIYSTPLIIGALVSMWRTLP